jgi:uncharacterized protein (DUF885 family)
MRRCALPGRFSFQFVAALALLCGAIISRAADRPATSSPVAHHGFEVMSDTQFRDLTSQFIEADLRQYPESATQQGDHRYDNFLTDMSHEGIQRRRHHAQTWKRRFQNVLPDRLSPANEADREWLVAQVDDELLSLEEIRSYERSPSAYLPTDALNSMFKRNFAPLETRMKAVTAREIAGLRNLAAARVNLKAERTAKVTLEIVLQQMPGVTAFLQKDLPAAFAAAPDGPAKTAFLDANGKLITAVDGYTRWLKDTLLPHATGNYAIGPENYKRMLADEEMVDIPLDELEEIGKDELTRLQAEFQKTAHQIDSNHSPAEVAVSLNREHPTAEQLLPTVTAGLAALREYVVSHHLATIPSDEQPLVRETPPSMRATSFASMDAPGPFEKSHEAYFYVTLPDPGWPPERREQLLELFSPALISDTSVHEVYPGHYVQFLNNRLNPDMVRALYSSGANFEGWALYCEQMMLDEGLHNGDPKYRLAQLQMALLRACRYLVGIRMHTKGMSVEDAEAFFQSNAYMTPHNAEVESYRGTEDPGYLRYQLGKLMILKLRGDVRKQQGDKFDLGKFHDAFLHEGAVPIRLIRRAMLGSDGPML